MSQILPFLFIGGINESQSKDFIKKHGITHVLNCAKELNCVFPNLYNAHIAIDDDGQDLTPYINFAIQFIDSAKNSNGKILVHCYAGVSRSVAFVMAYLIKKFNMTTLNSYKFILERRPNVNPHYKFMRQLIDFQNSRV